MSFFDTICGALDFRADESECVSRLDFEFVKCIAVTVAVVEKVDVPWSQLTI